MKEATFYKILRPILTPLFKLVFRPKIIGSENIPKDGRIILAGNHTSILDCVLLLSTTKRPIHFLAKNSLIKGPKKIIFNNLGIIPVNRKEKDPQSVILTKKYLESEMVIGIFPEGTTQKGRGQLPFKMGAVKIAKETNTKIVPFGTSGKYKPFKKGLVIIFKKPYEIKGELEKENGKLFDIVKKLSEEAESEYI